jgi:hypothetical protein
MDDQTTLYICPQCFRACESEIECHAHQMIECKVGQPGDERRKPVADRFGNFVSRAPRWFLEAAGWMRAGAR